MPFLLTVLMVGVGLWVRLRVSESPVFDDAARRQELVRAPLVEVLRHYPGRVLIGLFTAVGGLTTWFLITTFSVSYGTATLGIPSETRSSSRVRRLRPTACSSSRRPL